MRVKEVIANVVLEPSDKRFAMADWSRSFIFEFDDPVAGRVDLGAFVRTPELIHPGTRGQVHLLIWAEVAWPMARAGERFRIAHGGVVGAGEIVAELEVLEIDPG